MNRRDERIYEEAAALWFELFGEKPPRRAEGSALLDAIMQRLPETSYQRLASPFLRPSLFSGPRSRPAR